MKQKRSILFFILFILMIGIVGGLFWKAKQSKEGPLAENSLIYENGDYVYQPLNEEIQYDEQEGILFFEGLLNVMFNSELVDPDIKEIADEVNGQVVGNLQGAINMVQIKVEATSSYTELTAIANEINKKDVVKYASVSSPLFASDLHLNGRKKNSEIIDEVNPDGENWWAEAINAYSSWAFLDKNRDQFNQVNVAVFETGALGEDEEINDQSIRKESIQINHVNPNKVIYKPMGDTNISHGELVTKIIAADENDQTIRGIAEPVVNVTYHAMGNDIVSSNDEAQGTDSISEAEIISELKNSIVDNGTKVINHSWGFPPSTKKAWQKNKIIPSFFESEHAYEEFMENEKKWNDFISAQMIIALDELLKDESSREFLMVQSGGNGMVRHKSEAWDGETSIEARQTGVFANINEETYQLANQLSENQLEYNLENILNRILIVGGAELTKDKSSYKAPDWASYGEAIDIAAPAAYLFQSEDNETGFDGTSFAAPMVTGAAALVWSYHPDMTAQEVKQLLIASAEHQVLDKREAGTYEYPLLNVTAFLNEFPYNESIVEMNMNEYDEYKPLIDRYERAIREQWPSERLLEKDLGSLYDLPGPIIEDGYGYEFRDINGDGLAELVLGIQLDDGSIEVHEIYALQKGKPEKLFIRGIRSNLGIYKDGTVSVSYGMKSMGYYRINEQGEAELKEGYDLDTSGRYVDLMHTSKIMDESEVDVLHKKYSDNIGLIKHLFTPFIIEEGEAATKSENNQEKQAVEQSLSMEEVEQLVNENYKKIEAILLEDNIESLYTKQHDFDEAQAIWESGVDPSSTFYREMYQLLYPKLNHLVAAEGMESIINEKFSLYWQPPAVTIFFYPNNELELLEMSQDHFTVKQTQIIPPQDLGGSEERIVYKVFYKQENNEWKFAGAEKQ